MVRIIIFWEANKLLINQIVPREDMDSTVVSKNDFY